jgi:hypothetical protein
MSQSRIVHITSGFSASATLKQAFHLHYTEVLAFGDMLDGGPIIDFATPELWSEARNEYLKKLAFWDGAIAPLMTLPAFAATAAPDILHQADTIYFWTAKSVYEQLLLPWLIKLLSCYHINIQKLTIIEVYEPVQGKCHPICFTGISLLNPEQMQLYFQPQFMRKLATQDIEELSLAWSAMTSPSPEKMMIYCQHNHPRFPYLLQGLKRFMRRYPDIRSGLSHYDMLLLRESKTTRLKATRVIGGAMGNSFDDFDVADDMNLFYRLKKLGDNNLAHPALQLFGKAENMRETEVIITDMGTKFLNGEENFVKLNGIDDWVGGVHLTNQNRWYFNTSQIVRE